MNALLTLAQSFINRLRLMQELKELFGYNYHAFICMSWCNIWYYSDLRRSEFNKLSNLLLTLN